MKVNQNRWIDIVNPNLIFRQSEYEGGEADINLKQR